MDTLAAYGNPISDEDHILHVLSGVGLEYDSVVVHVTSGIEALSIPEVSALLLAHEGRIRSNTTNSDSTTPTVYAAIVSPQKKTENPNSYQGSSQRGRGRGRTSRGGRRGWNNYNGPVCQICGVGGHVANKSYYRFDKDFTSLQRQMGSQYPQQLFH